MQPWLVWNICIIALGLLAWRCVAIFATPPESLNPHPLSEIVATITGPGNAKISETASGELLILLNGADGAIDPAMAAQLTDITQAISASGAAPILKQLPFAEPTGFNLTNTEFAELAALGLLAGLAFYLALSSRAHQAMSYRAMSGDVSDATLQAVGQLRSDLTIANVLANTPPPPFDGSPVLTPIEGEAGKTAPRPLADAQSFAKDNPDITAKVIERWIRARGFHG